MSTGAEVACDGRSVTVRVPLTFRRRGGRKQVVAPEGWSGPALAPRPRSRRRHAGEGHRSRASLAGDAGERRLRLNRGAGPSRADQPVLPGARAPSYPARAGHRGEHPRRTARSGADHPRQADEAVHSGVGGPAAMLLIGRFTPIPLKKSVWGRCCPRPPGSEVRTGSRRVSPRRHSPEPPQACQAGPRPRASPGVRLRAACLSRLFGRGQQRPRTDFFNGIRRTLPFSPLRPLL